MSCLACMWFEMCHIALIILRQRTFAVLEQSKNFVGKDHLHQCMRHCHLGNIICMRLPVN